MIKRILFYITMLSILLFTNCSTTSKSSFLYTSFNTQTVKTTFTSSRISIIDLRNDTSSNELFIPVMSFPGQKDSVQPTLTSKLKSAILQETQKYLNPTGNDLEIKIYVIKAQKSFHASFFHEKEQSICSIKIVVEDGLHVPFYISALGDATLEMKSIDASQDYSEKLFIKTLRLSIYKAFCAISDFENSTPKTIDSIQQENKI